MIQVWGALSLRNGGGGLEIVAGQAEGVAGGAQIRGIGAAVRRVAAGAREAIAADRMEAVRQIVVAGVAEGVGGGKEKVSVVAAVGLVAGGALTLEAAVGAEAKGDGLAAVAGAAQRPRGLGEQGGMSAGVGLVAGGALARGHRLVLHTACGHLMACIAAICGHGGQAGRLLAVEFAVAGGALARGHRRVGAGRGRGHVGVAAKAGRRHRRARHLRIVRGMAGGAGGQDVGGMAGKGAGRVELLGMAGPAEIRSSLGEMEGIIAAMAIVAEQALLRCQGGVWLIDAAAMIAVTTVAEGGLLAGQAGGVRLVVETGVTGRALLIHIRLVGMAETGRRGQVVMTSGAGLLTDQRRSVFGPVRIVTGAAHQIRGLDMGREAGGGADLAGVAGPAQGFFLLAQDGRLLRAVGEMADIALALGQGGVGLGHDAAMPIMAAVAGLLDLLAQQAAIGAGVRFVAGVAIALGKGLMRVGGRRVWIGYFLPVTVTADGLHIGPQLHRVGVVEIMAGAARALIERLVGEIEALHRGRAQAHLGSGGGRRGGEEGGRRGRGRRVGRRRAAATAQGQGQEEHQQQDGEGA